MEMRRELGEPLYLIDEGLIHRRRIERSESDGEITLYLIYVAKEVGKRIRVEILSVRGGLDPCQHYLATAVLYEMTHLAQNIPRSS